MAIADETAFVLAFGKAAVIVVTSFGTVVYLAWIGVKRGLLKQGSEHPRVGRL